MKDKYIINIIRIIASSNGFAIEFRYLFYLSLSLFPLHLLLYPCTRLDFHFSLRCFAFLLFQLLLLLDYQYSFPLSCGYLSPNFFGHVYTIVGLQHIPSPSPTISSTISNGYIWKNVVILPMCHLVSKNEGPTLGEF